MGSFKGSGGSIRSISHHPTMPFIASSGLDRHLRIHHTTTRKTANKVYLKQRLNTCLFSAALPAAAKKAEGASVPAGRARLHPTHWARAAAEDGDEEAEEIWNELDERAASKRPAGGDDDAVKPRSKKPKRPKRAQ